MLYCVLSGGVALVRTCIVVVPCASGHCFPYDIVFQVFTSYTGGQSVSHVLLWQPSECVNLTVNCVICFRKINMMMMMMMSPLGLPFDLFLRNFGNHFYHFT